jgi:hypothetical protein
MNNKHLPLVETLAIPDTFVSGLAEMDDLGGGQYRFTWYVLQRSPLTGQMERSIVAKFVCSAEAAMSACSFATQLIGRVADTDERRPANMAAH